jgi:hypothetical protein
MDWIVFSRCGQRKRRKPETKPAEEGNTAEEPKDGEADAPQQEGQVRHPREASVATDVPAPGAAPPSMGKDEGVKRTDGSPPLPTLVTARTALGSRGASPRDPAS